MKNNYLNALWLSLIFFLSLNALTAQQTYVPDNNFENYLETHDANGNTVPVGDPNSMGNGVANDDYVTTANISSVTNLDVHNQNISDLTGIEDFAALEILNCAQNQLTGLDISQNTSLTNLTCYSNQLTSLNTSQNTALNFLHCGHNQLTNLDVTQNLSLNYLVFGHNNISDIDLSNNQQLLYLGVYDNPLNNIDFTNITALNVLECWNTNFTELDLHLQQNLTSLRCSFNPNLTELNIQTGNNTSISYFETLSTPNLTCIQVDDPAYSTANWTDIDPANQFSTNCHYNETYVPDDNFENYLETHQANGTSTFLGDPYSMGNGIANDDYVTTSKINTVTKLNVQNEQISDLTGIEDFTALIRLDASMNPLTIYNFSQNIQLQRLKLYACSLSAIDLSANVNLTELQLFDNQFSTIDISNLTLLEKLSIDDNLLNSLDITNNSLLNFLSCSGNQLNQIDLSQNTALLVLSVGQNQLTNLDLSNNTLLQDLSCENNLLTQLDISQNPALEKIWCHDNQLTGLDASSNPQLWFLYCFNNQLTDLNVANGNNTAFINFPCRPANNASNGCPSFLATGNPNLTCVFVDDKAYMNANWPNAIDATATYVETQAECNALDVENISTGQTLKILPNPAQNRFRVEYSGDFENTQLRIYNMEGRLVYQTSSVQEPVDVGHLKDGVYLVELKNENQAVIQKLVIAH